MKNDRFKMTPAIYVALMNAQDEVLLLRRFQTGYQDGKYSLPAGHVDGNEQLIHAIIRETKEEVGIDILSENIELRHVRHRNAEDGERLDFFFVCKIWSGEINNIEPHKCDGPCWASTEMLPENTIPYIRDVLALIKENIIYSDEGWE